MLTEFDRDQDGAAILARLATVLDPELDESISDLGFVHTLRVQGKHAHVALQLPTSWCAVNFAFIMAEDVRRALLEVEGIAEVTVRLGDHCAAAEIEAAVNEGKPFSDAFAGEGATGLEALRSTFLRKGFLVRQEHLLAELRRTGHANTAICAFVVNDGAQVASAEVLRRYLERRAELGLDCSPIAPLIVDENGAPIGADQLEAYYHQIRTVRVALQTNGSFCRALLAKRARLSPGFTFTNGGEAHVSA
jgi:metal-sulfur cluster biosynthetic enzyme